ncbi:MAG: ABC transporter [Candidatus Nephthysia bennettiae]|nr:MAG: ABC transporter [Candidatus Dormibacteraeota bacterium]
MPDRYCVGPSMAVDWGEEQPPRLSWCLVQRIFGYFLPYWRRGLIAFACIGAAAALGLAPALVTKGLIDYLAHPTGALGPLVLLVTAGVIASLLGGLIGVLQSYITTWVSEGIMFDLREQLFDRLLGQSMGFFTHSRSGDLLSRMDNDVGGIEDVVSDTVFGLVTNVLVAATTLVLMFALSWQLTLAALLLLPIFLVPSRYVGQATYRARKRTQEKLSEMAAYMQEVLGISGILLVKAFTKERAERLRFQGINHDLRRLQIRQAMIGRWFGMFTNVFATLGPALLLLFGGYLVISGRTTVGTVVSVVTILAGRLAWSAGALGSTHVNITGSLALFQRIFQYLDLPADVAEQPDAHELPAAQGAVSFADVSFAYPGASRSALDGVSLSVEPGRLVALVGPTGAGKTTITYLLARFYDPGAGSVRIDGTDLRHVTLESLSRQIGMVFQDSFLFHASVRDNLLYARPEASEEEMKAACRAAYIHDFIESLPEGYETVVGERGHRLSGGEKQRMAIARVIVKDPRIVILDEATSSLDTVSEQLVQAALRPLFASRTSFVIAHRLSTVLAADRILVIDRGRLVEAGTHDELVDQGGLYKTLYERQFKPERSPTVGLVTA